MTGEPNRSGAGNTVQWRLELFGGLRLWHNGQLIEKFSTRKTAGVLAYLACNPGKSVSRDTLADVFWADNDPESARNSLRVALNALRKVVANSDGSELLQSDRLTVRLDGASLLTDVGEFEAALREETRATTLPDKIVALTRAVSLYQGPFLAGWYEEWVGTEQNRFGEVFNTILRRLTSHLIESREYERALTYAQQAVQTDPLREESHRLVIRLHMVMGNPSAAMQQYRDLERILRKELGAIPSGATRDLLRQIPTTNTAETRPTPPPPTNTGTRPILSTPTTLPLPLTQFLGRDEELRRLTTLLLPGPDGFIPRLVSLTGMGGTGKSRLALETANRLQEIFGNHIIYAPLVTATTLGQVNTILISALRLTPHPDVPPVDQIVHALNGKRTLLILDNFEQLIDTCSNWLKSLLERLPLVTCLVTSRYRLGISGEQEMPLAPLPTPDAAEIEAWGPERLASIPSVALFLDRARAARADFRLTAQNATAIAAICAALDGLPLAIELAAAWIRMLTPTEMRNRLKERFDLLVSSHSDIPERHRSLRAVLDESFHLISEEDKRFFVRLSVFQGGWSLDAAETVTEEANALERLNLLQQRSLLLSVERDGVYRFRMLETVREYATMRLVATERQQYQLRHANYYRTTVDQLSLLLHTPSAEIYLSTIDAEQENITTALSFLLSLKHHQHEGVQLAAALWRYWYARGQVEQGMHWLEAALRFETISTDIGYRISLREGLGRLATSQGRNTLACRYFQQALTLAQQSTPERVSVQAMNLGLAAQAGSDAETARFAFQLVAEYQQANGDSWAQAAALTEVGKVSKLLGDDMGMVSALQLAHTLREQVGDVWGAAEIESMLSNEEPLLLAASGIGPVYLTLGQIAAGQNDHAIALPLFEDALAAFREQKDTSGIAITLERIGISALACNLPDRATVVLEEALALRLEGIGREANPFTRRLLDMALADSGSPQPTTFF